MLLEMGIFLTEACSSNGQPSKDFFKKSAWMTIQSSTEILHFFHVKNKLKSSKELLQVSC